MKRVRFQPWVGVAIACALSALGACASAQEAAASFPLYQGTPPGTEGWRQRERSTDLVDPRFNAGDTLVWNVTRPSVTVFQPPTNIANGAAVVVAPGGGFRVLSYANEGVVMARWLNAHGVTAVVLKYRLHEMPDQPEAIVQGMEQMARSMAASSGPPPITIGPVEEGAIGDGERAIAWVRQHAAEYAVDPHRIGIIGFSAGGVVAAGAAVRGRGDQRPDFVGIIYSFYPDAIPANAPTAFMAAAADDPLSVRMPDLFARWRAAGAPSELHIYAVGQHGFGTHHQNLPVDGWLEAFHERFGTE